MKRTAIALIRADEKYTRVIDKAAELQAMNRSEFIRYAALIQARAVIERLAKANHVKHRRS
jgi:uncharacterized protein (DUF1778 family)